MHASQLLDKAILTQCQAIHARRRGTLMENVKALLHGKKLSVTGLGRTWQSDAYEKHNIKRSDRLVGNHRLHQDREVLYRAMAQHIIGKHRQPIILVDWSDLSKNREFHLLRASLPVGGRALTLYEETHHRKKKAMRRYMRVFWRN